MSNQTVGRHVPEDNILHLPLTWQRFLQPVADRHQQLSFASFASFHPSLNLILPHAVIVL
jgi:hypothetical protein